MTVSYTINLEQKVVFTQVDGVVDGIQLREHQDRLGDDFDFKADMYELMDCSGITNVKMKTINNSQLAKSSPWGSDAKRAIVVPNLLIFGLLRIFQTVMSDEHGKISIFYNSASATAWLDIKKHK
jgi:hypothetical protein